MNKIRFKDLSWPLKTLVVYGFLSLAVEILIFIAGFIYGLVA